MRTKTFLLVLGSVILTSLLLILFGSANQPNDINLIVSQTHQQLKELHENLVSVRKKFEVDQKYLDILGFNQPIYNGTRHNFSVVSYIFNGQAASAILLAQNIAAKLPNEMLLIYDLGLVEDDLRALNAFCNNSKCSVITYDLSPFPSYITDEHMHAYRPLIIKDALTRSKTILFAENSVRVRGTDKEIFEVLVNNPDNNGILGCATRQAVSSRTHPKMFDYFDTDTENFLFLPMVSLDFILFVDTKLVNEKILLPWVKCALTLECIHPIGAQSGGCRYNKKPQYRYSGCHAYDTSAFNILLGLTWNLDENKYSIDDKVKLFYHETLEEATKLLENKRKNISETSEPFTDD